MSETARTVAPTTTLAHPLGEVIHIRINLQGCKGPFPMGCSSQDPCNSYRIRFDWLSIFRGDRIYSSPQREGEKTFQGTVYWNDTLYIEDCYEHSYIAIHLIHDDKIVGWYDLGGELNPGACMTTTELLKADKVSLWPYQDKLQSGVSYTLYLTATRVAVDDAVTLYHSPRRALNASNASPALAAGPWTDILRRLTAFVDTVGKLKVKTVSGLWAQMDAYTMFKTIASLDRRNLDPNIDNAVTTMVRAMSAIEHGVGARGEYCDRGVLVETVVQVHWVLVNAMDVALQERTYDPRHGQELSRLTILIATPGPGIGARSTSADSILRGISGYKARDALLFALEAIAEASDAFPPLKSAANGLRFLTTYADMASSNEKRVRDIYQRVDGLAAALRRGSTRDGPVIHEHSDAIEDLSRDIAALNKDLESIVRERKNRFKRYFSAKRHREELQNVMMQLETARANYTMAVATVTAMTTARVLAHVQTLTLVMGVSPLPNLDMTRTDAVTFPSGRSRIEEVRAGDASMADVT
ncbi:unnamed protein product [Peniophora sp. CBMAI 1063]|nr:unnamed protein product [Peniophora sp. CBMAI 1063]